MSRKLKSVVIRNFDDDSDSEGEIYVKNKEVKGVKKRNKLKTMPLYGDAEEEEDKDFQELTLKKEKRKKGLKMPLFGDLEDIATPVDVRDIQQEDIQEDTQEEIQSDSPVDDGPVIVSIADEEEQDEAQDEAQDFLPLKDTAKDFISLFPEASEVSDQDQDQEMNEEEYEELDDGRLPLSTREAELQKKMHDMEIKQSLYDMEISEDEEMTGWTSTKLRQAGVDTEKKTLPKLNLLNGTFTEEMAKLQSSIASLSTEQTQLHEEAAKLDTKKEQFDMQMEQLKQKLEVIGSLL